MQTIAGRQVDVDIETSLQERLDVNQVKCVESVCLLGLNEDVDIAVVAGHVAGGRPKDVERSNAARSDLRKTGP